MQGESRPASRDGNCWFPGVGLFRSCFANSILMVLAIGSLMKSGSNTVAAFQRISARVGETPLLTATMLLFGATVGAIGFARWLVDDVGSRALNIVMLVFLILLVVVWSARLLCAVTDRFRSR